MEALSIPHSQLSSSSEYGDSKSASKYARLNWYQAWRPSSNDNQWLRVELSSMYNINGLITQGWDTWWVKTYSVQYQGLPSSTLISVMNRFGYEKVGNNFYYFTAHEGEMV